MTRREGHVLYASDDKGFLPLATAIHSLLSTADPERRLRVSVMTGDGALTEAHRAVLARMVSSYAFATLEVIDVDLMLASRQEELKSPSRQWGIMIWARCLIGEVFRNEKNPIVYMDIDTLVCRDLGELYDLDMSDCGDGRPLVLGAVCEEFRESGEVHDPIWSSPLFDARAERYFNSGVLVMNTAAFCEERLWQRIASWYGEHKQEVVRPDQDALNCLFWDRTRFLHPGYNHCDGWLERQRKYSPSMKHWRGNSPKAVLEAVLEPRILHFWGARKPWKWNHRPEGARYAREMREAGLLDGALPGADFWHRMVGGFFAAYHAILRRQVEKRLGQLSKFDICS